GKPVRAPPTRLESYATGNTVRRLSSFPKYRPGERAGFSDFLEFSGISMAAELPECASHETTLQVYLLGCVPFEPLLRLQRRLHFEITGDRRQAALIVCEHPPTITVGRHGSRCHIHLEPEELQLRGWPIRWVSRGGGCILHVPGQLALYPVLPLDRLHCDINRYLHTLGEAIR